MRQKKHVLEQVTSCRREESVLKFLFLMLASHPEKSRSFRRIFYRERETR